MTTFSKAEIKTELTKINNWKLTKEGISKNFLIYLSHLKTKIESKIKEVALAWLRLKK